MSDLIDAQKLFRESIDAQREQRQQIEEDQRFSDPSNPDQWEPEIRRQRENDPGGKRPCLVLDQTGQYVSNVAGQVEKQPPAIHAIPVGGGADKQAAEQLDGRFRHIEYASRAIQHYQRAMTSAARLGVGYLIARPAATNRALNYQEPRISSEIDPLRVVFDPWSTETDGSDAQFGFLLTPLSCAEFKRRWPKHDEQSFGSTEQGMASDQRDSIMVAEQWHIVDSTANIIICTDANGQEQSLKEDDFWAQSKAGQQLQVVRTYKDKTRTVMWRRMSGADVLEKSEFPADSIGLVPVYGYVGVREGRMTYCGIPRRARVAQQAYNYHMSESMAFIGTAPRSPWLVAHASIENEGVKRLWDLASTEQRAYLPYQHRDEEGPIPPPTRVPTVVNVVNHMQGAEQAKADIQASIGMYQASLGAPSNETSGVAIEGRKQQGEASTAHFPSHLAASLGQLGKIVMQMDARLSDTRRKAALIGIDGAAGSVTVDPDQQEAFKRDAGTGEVSINPRRGEYGVHVVIGASYSTQRSQTNAAFGDIMRGNKEMAPIVAPFWAQTLDFPGSEKFAQALAAMAPAPVKAILMPEGEQKGPSPAELAQKLQQLQQALQEASSIAQEAQQDADEAHDALAKAQVQLADKSDSLEIDRYKAETERLKITGANEEQIRAITFDLINQMLSQPDPLPGDPDQLDDGGAMEEQTQGGPPKPLPAGGLEQPQEALEPQAEALEPAGLAEPPDQSQMAPEAQQE